MRDTAKVKNAHEQEELTIRSVVASTMYRKKNHQAKRGKRGEYHPRPNWNPPKTPIPPGVIGPMPPGRLGAWDAGVLASVAGSELGVLALPLFENMLVPLPPG